MTYSKQMRLIESFNALIINKINIEVYFIETYRSFYPINLKTAHN